MVITRSLHTGLVTFWTLAEWTDISRLREEWGAAGLEGYVPDQRAPVACLKDALAETFGGSQVLIRSLASKNGFVVVREQRGTEDNAYQTLFSARIIDGQQEPVFSNVSDDASKVLDAYRRYQGRLTGQQVGAALVRVLYSLGGTRLRPTGGVYWLPGDQVDTWERTTEAVGLAADGGRSVGYCISHELDEAAVLAVRDALVAEVTAETRRIAGEIQTGELGERALESRKNEAAALRQKVIRYEGMLNVALDGLKEGLESIEQSQALAALLLSAAATPFTEPTSPEYAHASVA
jgi:hypothetical protein